MDLSTNLCMPTEAEAPPIRALIGDEDLTRNDIDYLVETSFVARAEAMLAKADYHMKFRVSANEYHRVINKVFVIAGEKGWWSFANQSKWVVGQNRLLKMFGQEGRAMNQAIKRQFMGSHWASLMRKGDFRLEAMEECDAETVSSENPAFALGNIGVLSFLHRSVFDASEEDENKALAKHAYKYGPDVSIMRYANQHLRLGMPSKLFTNHQTLIRESENLKVSLDVDQNDIKGEAMVSFVPEACESYESIKSLELIDLYAAFINKLVEKAGEIEWTREKLDLLDVIVMMTGSYFLTHEPMLGLYFHQSLQDHFRDVFVRTPNLSKARPLFNEQGAINPVTKAILNRKLNSIGSFARSTESAHAYRYILEGNMTDRIELGSMALAKHLNRSTQKKINQISNWIDRQPIDEPSRCLLNGFTKIALCLGLFAETKGELSEAGWPTFNAGLPEWIDADLRQQFLDDVDLVKRVVEVGSGVMKHKVYEHLFSYINESLDFAMKHQGRPFLQIVMNVEQENDGDEVSVSGTNDLQTLVCDLQQASRDCQFDEVTRLSSEIQEVQAECQSNIKTLVEMCCGFGSGLRDQLELHLEEHLAKEAEAKSNADKSELLDMANLEIEKLSEDLDHLKNENHVLSTKLAQAEFQARHYENANAIRTQDSDALMPADALESVLNDSLSCEDVLSIVNQCYLHVTILPSAFDSARACQFENTKLLLKGLLKLAGRYFEDLTSSVPDSEARKHLGSIYRPKESFTTLSSEKYRASREFYYNGSKRLFEKHLTWGTKRDPRVCAQCHFDIIDGHLVIARLGSHLETGAK